jgi:hypothetical protein
VTLGDVDRTNRLQDINHPLWTIDELVADLVDVVTSVLARPARPGRRK